MTKMTDAFKKVFLGLGGNPKELAENNDVGDYIVDLESAIKEYVGDKTEDIIDDSTASETTVYSSSKVESLIPENELPTPAVGDIGKIVSVVSDGESGAEYSLETPTSGINKNIGAEGNSVRNFASITQVTIPSSDFSDIQAVADYMGDPDNTNDKIHLRMHIAQTYEEISPSGVETVTYEDDYVYIPLVSLYKTDVSGQSNKTYKFTFSGIIYDSFSNKLLRAVITFNNSLTGTATMTQIT